MADIDFTSSFVWSIYESRWERLLQRILDLKMLTRLAPGFPKSGAEMDVRVQRDGAKKNTNVETKRIRCSTDKFEPLSDALVFSFNWPIARPSPPGGDRALEPRLYADTRRKWQSPSIFPRKGIIPISQTPSICGKGPPKD